MEILKFDPCGEAIVFRSRYTSFKEAWDNCPRGDWMLWIAQKAGVNLKLLTKAKALCALTVKHLMKDKRSVTACEVALRFSDGLATREELDAAAYGAGTAYGAAAAHGVGDAYAADAAIAAAIAAAAAAAAAANAAYGAAAAAHADAAAADAKVLSRKSTAGICKELLTEEILKLIN